MRSFSPKNTFLFFLGLNSCLAMQERESDDFINDLEKKIASSLVISNPSEQPPAFFVINTIAHVPLAHDLNECDSDGEEDDRTFDEKLFDFNVNKVETYPFVMKRHKKEDLKRSKVCKKDAAQRLEETNSVEGHRMVQDFLTKLRDQGCEQGDKDEINKSVKVAIGLNRLRSLSTRKNNALYNELMAKFESNIECEVFGFFWKYTWYKCAIKNPRYPLSSTNVKYEKEKFKTVQKFYHQLKRRDKTKAEAFRDTVEKYCIVPYNSLRERVKNHPKTKQLVQKFRSINRDVPIYFSLIDSDTINFNGIYSAYKRILKSSPQAPTIMTTGYEFPGGDKNYPFMVGSQIDRIIRATIAKYVPLGVYYPEPNLCVLLLPRCDELLESFLDASASDEKYESAILIRDIKNKRQNIVAIFSGTEPPLITSIPLRVRENDKFLPSREFSYGASPSKEDITSLKNISQSHYRPYLMCQMLYVNRAYKLLYSMNRGIAGEIVGHFNSLFNAPDSSFWKDTLKKLISPSDGHIVEGAANAFKEVKNIIAAFEKSALRNRLEEKLIKVFSDEKKYDDARKPWKNIALFSKHPKAEELVKIDKGILDCLEKVTYQDLTKILEDESLINQLLEKERLNLKN